LFVLRALIKGAKMTVKSTAPHPNQDQCPARRGADARELEWNETPLYRSLASAAMVKDISAAQHSVYYSTLHFAN
jgi:hypothetical protein